MHLTAYLTLAAAPAFGAVAPGLARRLRPATASALLSIGSVVVAAGFGLALALLTFSLAARLPVIADLGGWSGSELSTANPISPSVGIVAATVLAVLLGGSTVVAIRQIIVVRTAFRLARLLPPAPCPYAGSLSITETPTPEAFSVPDRPGRIVVSRVLDRSLTDLQREIVLDHERSHLRHRHHLHRIAATIAAAANPALRKIPAAVTLSTERWADEDTALGRSRRDVARSLVEVAHTISAGSQPALQAQRAALGVGRLETTGSLMTVRISALVAAPPGDCWWSVTLLAMLVLTSVAGAVSTWVETETLFELLQARYSAASLR